MQAHTLAIEVRPEVGKQPAGRLRREGRLPGIFYGKKVGTIPVVVPVKELETILAREGENAILKVYLASSGGDREFTAVIREVQRHPLSRRVTHVDLYQISLEDKLRAVVPLVLEGEAAGVKEGGVLQQGLREVEVEGLPAELPESIAVDISNLGLGEHLTVADIKVPPGVKMLSDPEAVVATVVVARTRETETEAKKPAEELATPAAGQES